MSVTTKCRRSLAASWPAPDVLCRGPRIPLDKQRDAKSAQGLKKKSLLLRDSRDFPFVAGN